MFRYLNQKKLKLYLFPITQNCHLKKNKALVMILKWTQVGVPYLIKNKNEYELLNFYIQSLDNNHTSALFIKEMFGNFIVHLNG